MCAKLGLTEEKWSRMLKDEGIYFIFFNHIVKNWFHTEKAYSKSENGIISPLKSDKKWSRKRWSNQACNADRKHNPDARTNDEQFSNNNILRIVNESEWMRQQWCLSDSFDADCEPSKQVPERRTSLEQSN